MRLTSPARGALVGAGLVLACSASAIADDDVQRWLDRMSRAVETLDYRGTLVHVRHGEVETLRVIHRADEDGIRERIYSIDGEPREIIRDGNRIRCVLPGEEPMMLESRLASRLLPTLPINRLVGPESAYVMSLGGTERVADMMARIVHIQPRDAFRYGSRLWLEEKTGMLLRYALIDNDGRRLQQVTFTSLELGASISDSELEPAFSGREMTTTSLDQALQPAATRKIRTSVTPRVPRGYRLVNAGEGRDATGNRFEHLLYSDGLSSFSLYIEQSDGRGVGAGVEAMGPVHLYTAHGDERIFTVVGEVPQATVEYVGRQFGKSDGEATGSTP